VDAPTTRVVRESDNIVRRNYSNYSNDLVSRPSTTSYLTESVGNRYYDSQNLRALVDAPIRNTLTQPRYF